MNPLEKLKCWLEYWGGARDDVAGKPTHPFGWVLIGIWWMALLGAITFFCGQSSKFIYIDF